MAVAAAVRAARYRVRQPGTETFLHLAGQLVQRDQRAHQLKQAFEQADVDDLSDAAAQSHHRGEGCDDAGDLVGESDRRQQRLTVGLTRNRRRDPTSTRQWWQSPVDFGMGPFGRTRSPA